MKTLLGSTWKCSSSPNLCFFSWVYPFVVSTAHPSRLYPIKIPLKPMKSPFLKVKLPGSYGFPRVFLSLPLHELRFFTTLPPEVMPPAGRAPSPGARFEVRLPCRPAASASDLWVIVYIYFTSHIIYHNIYIYIFTYGIHMVIVVYKSQNHIYIRIYNIIYIYIHRRTIVIIGWYFWW